MKITDRKFLKYVKNTKNDLLQNPFSEAEVINCLKEIYNKKEITLFTVQYLYIIIEARKENFNYIKSIQDKESFEIVNKEHRYLEKFLNRYFTYSKCPITGLESVSIKELREVA